MKKILITGKSGQVGWDLQKALAGLGKIIAFEHSDADLANFTVLSQKIREIRPDIIINTAAYTDVEKAESEKDLAMAINGIAPGVISEEAKKLNALVIHYSTDYVFDGISQKPYTEKDTTNPVNEYGKTKLEGEKAIQAVGGQYLILRTSWIYSLRGKNFLLTMLKLGKEKNTLKIIDDQIGVPNWSGFIAWATSLILQKCIGSPDPNSLWGIYHLSAKGQTSWYGFTQAIFDFYPEYNKVELIPITTEEYPTKAIRPKFSVLSTEKLQKTFGLEMPDWKAVLEQCVKETLNSER